MKYILILLLLILPVTSTATYLNWEPEVQLGIGLRFPSQSEEPFVRPNLLAKAYFITFAEDEFFSLLMGAKLLGVGAQIDTSGSLRPVLSPGCVYLFNVCVGPDLIFNQVHKVDFGVSVSFRFF